ncbi:hypothetical protein CSUI_000562 [Cystoisospora suis]|uniref:Transmembrane protein n=1 Tax=Cystoisospora suis TaxID=483139 RepID=A0A2C6LBU7_9APIC|nr:hypothetical protein CSUI_000562 [Cystoisospora suis]
MDFWFVSGGVQVATLAVQEAFFELDTVGPEDSSELCMPINLVIERDSRARGSQARWKKAQQDLVHLLEEACCVCCVVQNHSFTSSEGNTVGSEIQTLPRGLQVRADVLSVLRERYCLRDEKKAGAADQSPVSRLGRLFFLSAAAPEGNNSPPPGISRTHWQSLSQAVREAICMDDDIGEGVTSADLCVLPLELLGETHESGAFSSTRDTTLCSPLDGEDATELAGRCDAENSLGILARPHVSRTLSFDRGNPENSVQESRTESAEKLVQVAAITALRTKLPGLETDCECMLGKVESLLQQHEDAYKEYAFVRFRYALTWLLLATLLVIIIPVLLGFLAHRVGGHYDRSFESPALTEEECQLVDHRRNTTRDQLASSRLAVG